jgi:hypothetical protein
MAVVITACQGMAGMATTAVTTLMLGFRGMVELRQVCLELGQQ